MKLAWLLAALSSGLAVAQSWEAGGSAGGGFENRVSVSNAAGQARTGFGRGPAFGGFITHHLYRRMAGEIRYTYRRSELQVRSGGSAVGFSGLAHAIHYDWLVYTRTHVARTRPFLAGGGGIKYFRGTGRERPYQPLSEFALLTRSHDLKPVISAGAGVKVRLSPRMALRIEFRDYITPFPKAVIAPAPGAKLSGWLHDFVPLAGLAFEFRR